MPEFESQRCQTKLRAHTGRNDARRLPPHRLFHGFLGGRMAAEMLQWAIENEDEFKPAVVTSEAGTGLDPTYRRSLSVSEFGPLKEILRQKMVEMTPALTKAFGVRPSPTGIVELELVAHNDLAFFVRHTDTITGASWADGGPRVLSAVYYVHRQPKNFSGGCLRLCSFPDRYGGYAFVDIAPEHNLLVVFPSWSPHEVLPVSCPSNLFGDSRFAVNIWLRAPERSGARPA